MWLTPVTTVKPHFKEKGENSNEEEGIEKWGGREVGEREGVEGGRERPQENTHD